MINLKALTNDLLKTSFREGEREGRTSVCVSVCFGGAYVEMKANSDFPDPRAARAEFQTRRSSAVQEIQLRVQSIFSLRSDDLEAVTHPHLFLIKHTHMHRIHT